MSKDFVKSISEVNMNSREMSDEEVSKDLENKVREMLTGIVEDAIGKLKKLEKSGCGILDDHRDQNCNYLTARAFLEAWAQDFAWSVGPQCCSFDRKRIKHYSMFL